MSTQLPLVAFNRKELKTMLIARDKRCVITGMEGTDAHEVLFKRSEKFKIPARSLFWHPYNCVLLNNAYHIEGTATAAYDALLQLQHLLTWHGETELNRLVEAMPLRIKPDNITQWAAQRAARVATIEDIRIVNDILKINGESVKNLRLKA